MALYYFYLLQHLCRQADARAAAAHSAVQHRSGDSSKIPCGILNKQEVAMRKLQEGIWPSDNPSNHLAF